MESRLDTLALTQTYISLLTPVAIIILTFFIYREWREFKRDRLRKVERDYQEQLYRRAQATNDGDEPYTSQVDNLGGYVIIDISEENKPVFRDLLNGFEEYAKLKGYKVSVSIKSNLPEKIAYRIDIDEHGVTKSTDTVTLDLKDYMREAKSGSDTKFQALPKVISEIEHEKITTALRNRIATLEVNYQLEKRNNEFLMNFAQMIPQGAVSHSPQPVHIYNGNLGMGDNRSYEANNSVNNRQGDEQNSNNTLIEGSTVNIGATHAEKSEIISKLDALLVAIQGDDRFSEAARHIANVKDELEEAKEPDVSRIKEWLDKAKSFFSMAEEGGEVMQKAKDAYEAVGQALT